MTDEELDQVLERLIRAGLDLPAARDAALRAEIAAQQSEEPAVWEAVHRVLSMTGARVCEAVAWSFWPVQRWPVVSGGVDYHE